MRYVLTKGVYVLKDRGTNKFMDGLYCYQLDCIRVLLKICKINLD